MFKFLKNKYFKFALAEVLYLAWVIWLSNYWFLLGLPVIFDMYISKKVNWAFWKKRTGKNSTAVEWLDALIFAVIAVTFINIFFFQNYKIPTGSMEKTLLVGDHLYVSKVAYGPKIPNTPLSFPFTQNTLPLFPQIKSYLEWIKLPYRRLAGFRHVKNDDIVVFNFPAGDTVILERFEASYDANLRDIAHYNKELDVRDHKPLKTDNEYIQMADKFVKENENFHIVVRPVDRRDNYIKRCVALPGDTLQVINTNLFINGKRQKKVEMLQYKYIVQTNGTRISPVILARLGVSNDETRDSWSSEGSFYLLNLDSTAVEKLRKFPTVKSVTRMVRPVGEYAENIFPHDPRYNWNEDNFGPLVMPRKGQTIPINRRKS